MAMKYHIKVIGHDPERLQKLTISSTEERGASASFIGFAGYYRWFIHDFAKIIRPINEPLKKNANLFCHPNAKSRSGNLKGN